MVYLHFTYVSKVHFIFQRIQILTDTNILMLVIDKKLAKGAYGKITLLQTRLNEGDHTKTG